MKTSKTGDVIRQLIEDKNLNQTTFGKTINVSQGMVGQWLRGERPVSVDKAIEIESIHGADASELNSDVKKSRESQITA